MSHYITSAIPSPNSPGYSFGRSGNVNAGTYLQAESVPSNQAGRIVPFNSSRLSHIFISCSEDSTFTIEIGKRVSNTFSPIHTSTVTASRIFSEEVTGVELNLGDEIYVKLNSGSAKNIVVGLIITGS